MLKGSGMRRDWNSQESDEEFIDLQRQRHGAWKSAVFHQLSPLSQLWDKTLLILITLKHFMSRTLCWKMDNGLSWGYKDLSGSKTGWGWGVGWKVFSKALWLCLVLSSLTRCGRQNNGPKDVHILIPRTCEYGTLDDKRDFAGLMKLRILRWEDYPRLEVGPVKSSEFLLEGDRTEREKCEHEVRGRGTQGPRVEEWRQPLEADKGKKIDSTLGPSEARQLCQPVLELWTPWTIR